MGKTSTMLGKSGLTTMLVLSALGAAVAQEPVSVTVDRAKVFRIEQPASTVIVGNPAIADVSMHDRNTVVVTGKSYGSTNLIILDATNEPIIDEVIIVTATDENAVAVTRRTSRTTYSCAPACEPILRLGDGSDAFQKAADQSTLRNDLAVKAASGN